MTNLAAALAAAVQIALPLVSQERIMVVTEDMVAVVKEETSNESLRSALVHDDALALLTAAVVNESAFREDVETCKVSGDGGRSVGLGQVMRGQNWEGHTRNEICSDRKLQLRLALHVIDRCWERTPRPDAALRCYAAGDAAKKSSVAARELNTFRRVRPVINLQNTSPGSLSNKEVAIAVVP